MNRVPIIRRVSIYRRHSIYRRTSVYRRKPLYPELSKFRTCELLYNNSNWCKNNGKYINRCMEAGFDFDRTFEAISHGREHNKTARLIVDFEVDERILWAASYADHNILQINVFLCKKDLSWVGRLSHIANKCGMIVVLFLFPIVPNRIMPHHVLRVIDMVKNLPSQYIMLRFAESKSRLLEHGNWMNINGKAVDKRFIQVNNENWGCSPLFKERFMKLIMEYTEPRGIKIGVCGDSENCIM